MSSIHSAIPDGLPDAAYIMSRLTPGVTQSLQQPMQDLFTDIVPILLSILAQNVESAMPSNTFYDEPIYISGRLPRALPQFWPIINIQRAVGSDGTTALRVGQPIDLAKGKADLAISPNGAYLMLGPLAFQPTLFLTYSAGYDTLPLDLLEVFFEMAMLVWKEKDRAGQLGMKIEGAQVASYTRNLPRWCKATLNNYRRMEYFL